MSACIVWIDSEHAKLFKISPEGVEKQELKSHAPNSSSHQNNFKAEHEKKFFHQVASTIGKVEELLIFGAGTAKTHFKHHLETHHHADLAKHVVGLETLDHVTDNQILEAGRKFFKKYNTYHTTL